MDINYQIDYGYKLYAIMTYIVTTAIFCKLNLYTRWSFAPQLDHKPNLIFCTRMRIANNNKCCLYQTLLRSFPPE